MNIKKQFQDVLSGFAVGDAFGAGIEFQDRDWIRENIDFTSFVNVRHKVPALRIDSENYRIGEYTDDTEMTLGLIKALISGRPFTEKLLIKYWKQEYFGGLNAKGHGRTGHGSMRWVYSGEKTVEEVKQFQQQRKFPGNAPGDKSRPHRLSP